MIPGHEFAKEIGEFATRAPRLRRSYATTSRPTATTPRRGRCPRPTSVGHFSPTEFRRKEPHVLVLKRELPTSSCRRGSRRPRRRSSEVIGSLIDMYGSFPQTLYGSCRLRPPHSESTGGEEAFRWIQKVVGEGRRRGGGVLYSLTGKLNVRGALRACRTGRNMARKWRCRAILSRELQKGYTVGFIYSWVEAQQMLGGSTTGTRTPQEDISGARSPARERSSL